MKIELVAIIASITIVIAQNCTKFQWRCDNSECIHSTLLCDGKTNCRDSSDETPNSCNNIICPAYSFRCSYGACVRGLGECDGVRDCADNSDETSLKCPGVHEDDDLSGSCLTHREYQCDSGECIKSADLCDGIVNCPDGSDETEKRCLKNFCPAFSARCTYGACIDANALCDRKQDCADGFDESVDTCGPIVVTPTLNPNKPTSKPTTTPPPPPDACLIPEPPENGRIVSLADANVELRQGMVIGEAEPIEYRCYSKYVLVGNATNYCFGGLWLDKTPKCKKYCDPLPLNKISIKATCEYNGKGTSCKQPLPPGTRVSISCNIGYRRPDRPLPDIIICDPTGEWHSHPWKCEEVCGIPTPDIIPFVVGGELTDIRKVPWHVGIHGYSVSQSSYIYLCGGTIISSKLVLSAAHCFWNPFESIFFEKEKFLVAAGKSLRDLNAHEETSVQMFNITELIVKQEYNHEDGLFYQDIAILVLSDFIIFHPHILPACIDFRLNDNDRYIPSGWDGIVSGWGKTLPNGELSNDLKLLRLPSVDYLTCKNYSTPSYRKYITGDKFCAGHLTGESVCQGDSGGGLLFPRNIDDVETFYVYGIVSNGPVKENSCDNTKYSLFTNVHLYLTMIRDAYFSNLSL